MQGFFEHKINTFEHERDAALKATTKLQKKLNTVLAFKTVLLIKTLVEILAKKVRYNNGRMFAWIFGLRSIVLIEDNTGKRLGDNVYRLPNNGSIVNTLMRELEHSLLIRYVSPFKDFWKGLTHDTTLQRELAQCISWALNKKTLPPKPKDIKADAHKQKYKDEEKTWGNLMIDQKNNGQWTTSLGETLVKVVLCLLGHNPRKPENKNGLKPDWETDECIWEVKTSNWLVDGTAGEKVLGTGIKYQDVPELYGKPLRIVCLANQEYEFEYGKTKYFGNEVTPKTRQILDILESWQITYVRFSDLISPLIN